MSLPPKAIASLLEERCKLLISPTMADKLAIYLELLLRWNSRTNLTAIREPESIVVRHFGESLQCAAALPASIAQLLDYGSGAGFPGAICALAKPAMNITLAESQNRKAAFLQELCRSLGIAVTVHAGRVQAMPPLRLFDAITLRAVDRMEEACSEALGRLKPGGWLVLMTTRLALEPLAPALNRAGRLAWRPPVDLQGSDQGILAIARVLRHPSAAKPSLPSSG